MGYQQDYQKIKSKLSDRTWRLNNLYYIKNKAGKKILFRMNWAQRAFYRSMWYVNILLKARQLGFSTFIVIYMLDASLFNSNHKCGIIDYALPEAIKKLEKAKFAYHNLPVWLKNERQQRKWGAQEIEFSNGSGIVASTSHRGDTLQKLHISEYGKISARFPDKATEIKTGALNAVESGQQIFIESTAEGKVGEFFLLVELARKLKDSAKKLAKLEPKFFFFAWWHNPEYSAPDEETADIVPTAEHHKYFAELEREGVELTANQKAWYVIKEAQQGEDMMQEYPSSPDEAFRGSLKGAFYTREMKTIRERGQICYVPYNPKYPVHTWWDLGTNDLMTCLFYQNIAGKHSFIDYHESSNEGWEYYAKMLAGKDYNYGTHNFPHDGNKRLRGKQILTDKQIAEDCGIRPIKITPRTNDVYKDILNHCKPVLINCFFDESKCAKLIVHLDNYRRKWSQADNMYSNEHVHDEASHGSDGFRTFAVNADNIVEAPRLPVTEPGFAAQNMGVY